MRKIARIAAGLAAALAFSSVFLGVSVATPVLAQELKIGIKTEPSALDPQFHTLNPNIQVGAYFFDPLIAQDADLKTKPALALSWKAIDDTTWEFKLRPGVKSMTARTSPPRTWSSPTSAFPRCRTAPAPTRSTRAR